MISNENNRGRAILAIAAMMISSLSAWLVLPRFASSVVQFSTITIVASAISPTAIASPARDSKLIVWPNAASGSTVNKHPSNSTVTGATAARPLRNAQTMTIITTASSYAKRAQEILDGCPDEHGPS